eukprot:471964-Rhodomonas_salina.2
MFDTPVNTFEDETGMLYGSIYAAIGHIFNDDPGVYGVVTDDAVYHAGGNVELAEALANYVVTCYKEAIETRGRFAIALTGGR